MPGSVKIKSTGFKEPSVRYSDERVSHEDPACPHPRTDGVPGESVGSRGSAREYTHEVKGAGWEGPGVGHLTQLHDAAHNDIASQRDPANRHLE